MSSSGDSAACPSDPVVFTCTVVGRTNLRWTVAPPPDHPITAEQTQIVTTSSSTLQPFGVEGFMFEAAVANTSSDSLTSTLTTLTENVASLNGTFVSCTGDQTELLTIIVAGERTLHSAHSNFTEHL